MKLDNNIFMNKKFSLAKVYCTMASIVSLFGAIVALGIALYTYTMLHIITTDEYIIGNSMNYELTNCEQPLVEWKSDGTTITTTKSTGDIALCQNKAKANMITRRWYEAKQSIIGGLVRGMLFFIVLVTHLPSVIRKESDPESII